MTAAMYRECRRAVHVVTREGRVLTAGRASLFVLAELGWKPVATLFSQVPFVWLVEAGYRVVANNRRFFSRFMFRREV